MCSAEHPILVFLNKSNRRWTHIYSSYSFNWNEAAGDDINTILGGIDIVAPFITVNEQAQSYRDCRFRSSVALFDSVSSNHQNYLKGRFHLAENVLCQHNRIARKCQSHIVICFTNRNTHTPPMLYDQCAKQKKHSKRGTTGQLCRLKDCYCRCNIPLVFLLILLTCKPSA